jgi:hypothetical protein
MSLKKLFDRAVSQRAEVKVHYMPTNIIGERWKIKYYPDPNEDNHFWAYHKDVDMCADKLIDEMEAF